MKVKYLFLYFTLVALTFTMGFAGGASVPPSSEPIVIPDDKLNCGCPCGKH